MELTPREKDKLLLFTAALLAERRKARGLKLNYPEAIAYLSAAILEGARDGRTVTELMSLGTTLLGPAPRWGLTASRERASDPRSRCCHQNGESSVHQSTPPMPSDRHARRAHFPDGIRRLCREPNGCPCPSSSSRQPTIARPRAAGRCRPTLDPTGSGLGDTRRRRTPRMRAPDGRGSVSVGRSAGN